MIPLRIHAELRNGYVCADPWSPAIDGIMAAIVMRDRLGEDQFTINAAGQSNLEPVDGLPLGKEECDAAWWYLASSPRPCGLAAQEERYYHRRFDDHAERYLAAGTRRVMTAAGPYKTTRLSNLRMVCAAIEWHVVGDQPAIEAILRRVDQVGGKRGSGYGEVTAWRVEPGGDAQAAATDRPLPEAYARKRGLTGPVILRGLVPPVRLSSVPCVMPLRTGLGLPHA